MKTLNSCRFCLLFFLDFWLTVVAISHFFLSSFSSSSGFYWLLSSTSCYWLKSFWPDELDMLIISFLLTWASWRYINILTNCDLLFHSQNTQLLIFLSSWALTEIQIFFFLSYLTFDWFCLLVHLLFHRLQKKQHL